MQNAWSTNPFLYYSIIFKADNRHRRLRKTHIPESGLKSNLIQKTPKDVLNIVSQAMIALEQYKIFHSLLGIISLIFTIKIPTWYFAFSAILNLGSISEYMVDVYKILLYYFY